MTDGVTHSTVARSVWHMDSGWGGGDVWKFPVPKTLKLTANARTHLKIGWDGNFSVVNWQIKVYVGISVVFTCFFRKW